MELDASPVSSVSFEETSANKKRGKRAARRGNHRDRYHWTNCICSFKCLLNFTQFQLFNFVTYIFILSDFSLRMLPIILIASETSNKVLPSVIAVGGVSIYECFCLYFMLDSRETKTRLK